MLVLTEISWMAIGKADVIPEFISKITLNHSTLLYATTGWSRLLSKNTNESEYDARRLYLQYIRNNDTG